MWTVILIRNQTLYLVDTCAGGTWSRREADACWFDSYRFAVESVGAAELGLPLRELEETWDVVPLSPGIVARVTN
jgi:hypothetical protein